MISTGQLAFRFGPVNTTKKRQRLRRCLFQGLLGGLAGASRCTSRASAVASTEVNRTGQSESDIDEVDLDRFYLFNKFFVDDVFESIDFKLLIGLFWLIQSQCQRWAASAARVQENPNGRDFFTFKILSNLMGCCRSDFDHALYPPWLVQARNPITEKGPEIINFSKN